MFPQKKKKKRRRSKTLVIINKSFQDEYSRRPQECVNWIMTLICGIASSSSTMTFLKNLHHVLPSTCANVGGKWEKFIKHIKYKIPVWRGRERVKKHDSFNFSNKNVENENGEKMNQQPWNFSLLLFMMKNLFFHH